MRQVKQGDNVKVNYTGKLQDGQIFDSSEGIDPLQFTVGSGEVIPGFDQAVIGLEPGAKTTVHIAPHDAYGPRNEDLVATVKKADLPEDLEYSLGSQLQVSQEDGNMFVVTVTEVTDEAITLDANHPLAGQTLIFDIELVEIA